MSLWFWVSGPIGWELWDGMRYWAALDSLRVGQSLSTWDNLTNGREHCNEPPGKSGKGGGGGNRQPQFVHGLLDTLTYFRDGCAFCSVFHLSKWNKIAICIYIYVYITKQICVNNAIIPWYQELNTSLLLYTPGLHQSEELPVTALACSHSLHILINIRTVLRAVGVRPHVLFPSLWPFLPAPELRTIDP